MLKNVGNAGESSKNLEEIGKLVKRLIRDFRNQEYM